MYLFQVDLTKSLFRNVKVLNMFDEVLNQFSKQDLFHRASRVDRFSLGYIAILDEYRVAANYHKSQRTVACRSELGHIDARRLIFLVRSASAIYQVFVEFDAFPHLSVVDRHCLPWQSIIFISRDSHLPC